MVSYKKGQASRAPAFSHAFRASHLEAEPPEVPIPDEGQEGSGGQYDC